MTDAAQVTSGTKRVTDVLFALTESETPLSVRALADTIANSRSSTHRILLKLAEEGYAELRGDGGYIAGPRLVELGARTFAIVPILRYADSLMRQMVDELDNTCYLATFDEQSQFATYIKRVESGQPVRHIQPLGTRLPLHAGAVGKVMLAHAKDINLDAIDFERYTPDTLTDLASLRADLELIRQRGFAVSRAERVDDVIGVAAAVISGGSVVGGLTTAIPGRRFADVDVDEVGSVIVRYATQLSDAMSSMGVRRL